MKFQGKVLKGPVVVVANSIGDCKGCANSKQISRSLSSQCLHAVVQTLASSSASHKNKLTKQEMTKVMSSFEYMISGGDRSVFHGC